MQEDGKVVVRVGAAAAAAAAASATTTTTTTTATTSADTNVPLYNFTTSLLYHLTT